MKGQYFFVWIVLLCAPQVYGHDTVEERLLKLERVVKFQNEAIAQQRETLVLQQQTLAQQGRTLVQQQKTLVQQRETLAQQQQTLVQQRGTFVQQRESQEQLRQEIVLIKTDNDLLKDKVKNLDQQVDFLIKTADHNVDIENSNKSTETNIQPNVDTEGITVPEGHGGGPVHETLDKRRGIGTRSASDVAFYAYLNGVPCVHDQQTFVFNHEITDLANAYNPTDGIFVVPTSGTYVFTWTTSARDDFHVTELEINGNGVANAFVDAHTSGTVSQATGTVVINVNQGDQVFIRKLGGRSCNIYDNGYRLNSFAGWRLFG